MPEFSSYVSRKYGWYLGVAERTTKLTVRSSMKGTPRAVADGSPEIHLWWRAPVDHRLVDLVHEKQREGVRKVHNDSRKMMV